MRSGFAGISFDGIDFIGQCLRFGVEKCLWERGWKVGAYACSGALVLAAPRASGASGASGVFMAPLARGVREAREMRRGVEAFGVGLMRMGRSPITSRCEGREQEVASIAIVVNSLYRRSKVKELPVQERKLYDNALSILVDETSSVLGIGTEEIKKKIFAKLEK